MSTAYADLGGGTAPATPTRQHQHRYDRLSGWCGCGRNESGRLAEGSPAWAAARRTEAR